jgi:hypothetical protein
MTAVPFDPKPLYQAIGEYVVGFQWLVNKLWLAATFAEHPEQSLEDRWVLLDLSVAKLIDRFQEASIAFSRRWALAHSTLFEDELDVIVDKCHQARRQRNRLIHSAYVHLEAGGELHGILRSDISSRGASGSESPVFDQEIATPELFQVELRHAVDTGILVSQCHIQFIHWYRPTRE